MESKKDSVLHIKTYYALAIFKDESMQCKNQGNCTCKAEGMSVKID